jgi:filamentous hemagglutinin family protein
MIGNFHLQDGRVEFRWKRWRNKKRQEVSCCLMVLLSGMVLLGGGGVAAAGPTGGQITGGAGTLNYGGATTTINQKSQVITINWQTFSTARYETVDFNQPNSSSLAINYVVGGVPSVLQGALNADGRVYILNSAGITFTGTSHVNVGALLATTAMTIDGDPTKKIDVKGKGAGRVINQGSIQVSDGGFAILAAPYVENTGFIKADLGTIALAGTNKFTLDLRGDGLINFVVPPEAVEKIKSDGTRVGVNNTGTLQARSGQVLISASVATQVVNAAVNMSGVVDASAFAPNGKGGSVLITSEGDINLSGQVSAAGAGSGAGGQIITKAVGADNINRKAVMTAAGGNGGGQGGQIEVSGHDVLLSGNIDPGAGGTLMVDPYNAIITPTKGFNDVAGSIISEAFISKQLRHNVAVDIQASHDIVFAAAGNSHVLAGGNGNLTLDAANDIIFNVNDYVIETRSGAVTLTAGGDIGDPARRLSVVSGEGNHGPGVNAAGDILLTAGNDIYVDTITATASRKGKVTASFSANAAGDFSAAGVIDVEAMAKGKGSQQASAGIHITAGNDIILHGLTDLASVQSRGKGGNLTAIGDVDLIGNNVTDTGNVDVQAAIAGRVAHSVLANANLLLTAASAVQINGNVTVAALANLSRADSVSAHALTELGGNDVTVAGAINVAALASDRGTGIAVASALVSIHGTEIQHFPFPAIFNLGSVTDRASANVGGGGPAKSLADVTIQTPGLVQVAGAIDVSANAHNFGGGPKGSSGVAASANAELAFPGGETTVAQDITVGGPISVVAHGTNSASGGVAAHGRFGFTEFGVQLGDVLVDAVALNKGSHANGAAVADASFSPSGFVGGAVTINSINVQALASNLGIGSARAMAIGRLQVGSGAPGSHAVFDMRGGDISVDAAAVTGPNAHSNASALASLSLIAGGDGAAINAGPIDVEAHASDHGAGNAVASAHTKLQASDGIEGAGLGIGPLTDVASANNWGGGAAMALANATVIAAAEVPAFGPFIFGNVLVAANAHDYSGVSALANAEFLLGGSLITAGDISLISRATNDHDGEARSRAAVAIGTVANASSIHIANLVVDALASERGVGAASATALTDIRAQLGSSGNGNITMGALTDRASANNMGGGPAKAIANVTLQAAGALQVAGPIIVLANANNLGSGNLDAIADVDLTGNNVTVAGNVVVQAAIAGRVAHTALADANLVLDAASAVEINGNVTVAALANLSRADSVSAHELTELGGSNVTVAGAIDVEALASDGGSGEAAATALLNVRAVETASFSGQRFSFGGLLNLGSITGRASAHNGGGGPAKGLVDIAIENLGLGQVTGPINVSANAHNLGGLPKGSSGIAASANADLALTGGSGGLGAADVTVVAHGTNSGSGGVAAHSRLALAGFNGVGLGNAQVDAVALNEGSHGNGAAVADASFSPSGFVGAEFNVNSINVQALASNFGMGGARAEAIGRLEAGSGAPGSPPSISVPGGVSVGAVAITGPNAHSNASALASLSLAAGGDHADISAGPIDVEALASDNGAGNAVAAARTNISAVSSSMGVGVGALTDIANANNRGGGAAKALAQTAASGEGTIFAAIGIGGDVLVAANAHDFSGSAASAGAGFTLGPLFDRARVNISGDISVSGRAINNADGEARSKAAVSISSASSIHIGNVLVDALASERGAGLASASALADLRAQPGLQLAHSGVGNITIGSLVDNASAHAGGGAARSLADVTVETPGLIRIAGPVDVSAGADNSGNGPAAADGIAASANADLTLSAGDVSVGNISVIAHGTNSGAGGVRAGSRFHVAGQSDVGLGDVLIDVTALNEGEGGAGGALASASLNAAGFGGALTVNGANIHALADSQGTGGGRAAAIGAIREGGNASTGPHVFVAGGIAVDAAAITGPDARANASALASLAMAAGGSGGGVSITVQGPIAIEAAASDRGAGNGVASALGHFRASGEGAALDLGSLSDAASTLNRGGGAARARADVAAIDQSMPAGAIDIAGNIILLADARNISGAPAGTGGIGAWADATLSFSPGLGRSVLAVDGDIAIGAHATNSGSGGVAAAGRLDLGALDSVQLHNVTIDVSAIGGSHGGGPGALADASFLAAGHSPSSVAVNGLNDFHLLSLDVTAHADSQGSGGAVAHAIGRMREGSLSIPGGITIDAVTMTGRHGLGNASALASLGLDASSGRVTVGGPIEVAALAIDQGAGGAVASALQDITARSGTLLAHSIRLGPLSDKASAVNEGAGSAKALARTALDTFVQIEVQGDIDLSAIADDGRAGAGASANAGLTMDVSGAGLPLFSGPVVNGHVSVLADGVNSGSGAVVAHAAFDIAGIDVSLGDVLIDAAALNKGRQGAGATASADFATPRTIFGTFAVNSLNMQAQASSHGIGGARAAAIAPLTAAAAKGGSGLGSGFVIPGGITLDAAALTFSRAQENASALASLALAGLPSTGARTGPIDVEALASDGGAGNAVAAALAAFDLSGAIDIESLTVKAQEVNRGPALRRLAE